MDPLTQFLSDNTKSPMDGDDDIFQAQTTEKRNLPVYDQENVSVSKKKEMTWEEELAQNIKDMETSDEDEAPADRDARREKQGFSKFFAPARYGYSAEKQRANAKFFPQESTPAEAVSPQISFETLSPLAQLTIYEAVGSAFRGDPFDWGKTHQKLGLNDDSYESLAAFEYQRGVFLSRHTEIKKWLNDSLERAGDNEELVSAAHEAAENRMKGLNLPNFMKMTDIARAAEFCQQRQIPLVYIQEWADDQGYDMKARTFRDKKPATATDDKQPAASSSTEKTTTGGKKKQKKKTANPPEQAAKSNTLMLPPPLVIKDLEPPPEDEEDEPAPRSRRSSTATNADAPSLRSADKLRLPARYRDDEEEEEGDSKPNWKPAKRRGNRNRKGKPAATIAQLQKQVEENNAKSVAKK